MNKPLLAAWATALIGLAALQYQLRSASEISNTLWYSGLVGVLFFASAVLFTKGARQTSNIVRKITAWVMASFLLLNSAFFFGFILMRAMGTATFGG